MSYRVQEAYNFYRDYIQAGFEARRPFYEERNIQRLEGAVPAQDWEVFGAILVDDVGDDSPYGADLTRHEIKSKKKKPNKSPSFEYQYHKNAWREKLAHDKTINHVFVVYESGYESFEAYTLGPEPFARHVEEKGWFEKLRAKYEEEKDRGRCNIPFTLVRGEGSMILKVENGRLSRLPERSTVQDSLPF